MARRTGLGQRGLDILIPARPSQKKTDGKPDEEKDKAQKKKKTTGRKTSAASTKKKGSAAGKVHADTDESVSKDSANNVLSMNEESLSEESANETAVNGESEQSERNESISGGSIKEETVSSEEETREESAVVSKAKEHGAGMKSGAGIKSRADDYAAQGGQLMVDINKVEPNRDQPRKQFDEDTLQELADSIKVHGVIQPLIVQKREDYYEIVAGERRWRAAKIAGLKEIPVLVRDYTDREIMELSLIENIQRQDLNPIEEAAAYKRLIEEYSLTQDEVAERVSKSRAAVTNALRLLKLDPRVQDMLVNEMLSTGHVRALLAIEDGDLQFQMAQKAFDEKMSVREVESYVKKLLKKPAPVKPPVISQQLQTIYSSMEEKMKTSLRTKVSIQSKTPEKGKIEIEYYSSDELERIYNAILNGENE